MVINMELLDFLNNIVFGPGLTAVVFISGIVMTAVLRPYRLLSPHRLRRLMKSAGAGGRLSPAKALCVALAGTLGVGNIAGVASAVTLGGAGAVFWMWLGSLFAMVIKYAETVLALRHRRRAADGFHGGAFFYISDLGTRASGVFAKLFALLCLASSLTIGGSIQSNAAATCLESRFGLDTRICAIIMGLGAFAVISGGLARIAGFTSAVIPAMSVAYAVISLYIIIANARLMPQILREIIEGALGREAFAGGIVGFLTSRTLGLGVTRGIVSNEAGCGTAPIAHSSSDAKEPAAQGVLGIIEVFIDTVVLCSLTAFVVLIARARGAVLPEDGMAAALAAFGEFLPFAGVFMSAAVTVFAFGTMLCWYYYGSECLRYLTGKAPLVYAVVYCASVIAGAFASGRLLWSLSDFTISAMTALNLVFVLLCIGEEKRETDSYLRSGG